MNKQQLLDLVEKIRVTQQSLIGVSEAVAQDEYLIELLKQKQFTEIEGRNEAQRNANLAIALDSNQDYIEVVKSLKDNNHTLSLLKLELDYQRNLLSAYKIIARMEIVKIVDDNLIEDANVLD